MSPARASLNGPADERVPIADGEPVRLSGVVRADLARFLVDCASEDAYIRQAVAVGS